jgi:hypothetical protein
MNCDLADKTVLKQVGDMGVNLLAVWTGVAFLKLWG